jgi:hypothetical protein
MGFTTQTGGIFKSQPCPLRGGASAPGVERRSAHPTAFAHPLQHGKEWTAWAQALQQSLQAQTDLLTRLESFVATHG